MMTVKKLAPAMAYRLGKAASVTAVLAAAALTGAALAQEATVADNAVPNVGLDIPENLTIFGKLDPNVRKPTAIVNESVITGTDVDQRVALIEAANQLKLNNDDRNRLKLQILRSLIDETLQIQEAKANEIEITPAEINQSFARIARNFERTEDQFRVYLREIGSSEASLRKQIQAELAWQRFLRRRVEPFVNVGEEEVKSILSRLEASKGTEEYHVKEIYLSATPDRAQQVFGAVRQMIEKIQKGEASFEYFASNFSEASTRAVGGDLDWVRAAQLPEQLAAVAQQMQIGQIAGPIEVPGGFSVLYLVDKRQVLMADPRDARLSLKQLTIRFAEGTTQQSATARAGAFAEAVKKIQGCGDVNKAAAALNAEVVDSDAVVARELPPQLQDILLKLQVGEATPPFGSVKDGVRALVLCGRDDPRPGNLPGMEQMQGRMEQARVNLRAQNILRDLRRDAVVEYR